MTNKIGRILASLLPVRHDRSWVRHLIESGDRAEPTRPERRGLEHERRKMTGRVNSFKGRIAQSC
jgi:hypothetical protein